MALRRVDLVDDELGTFTLLDLGAPQRLDLFLQRLDSPSPAMREVTDEQTGDGVDDRTLYVGPRATSVELRLCDTPETLMGQLRPYLSPRRRPRLVVVDTEWAQTRRQVLRGVSWPGERTDVGDRVRDVQLQWTVPSGTWEADEALSQTVAAATGGSVGRTYDMVTPRTYPSTSSGGVGSVVNAGDLPAPFVARLYGPAIGPRLTDDATGLAVAFTSELVLAAGEFVQIDTGAQTAYLSGSTDSSVLPMLDFDATSWWSLRPGTVPVRYNPASGVVSGAVAVIDYRPQWL